MASDKIEIFWTDLVGFECPECKSRRVRQKYFNYQTPQFYTQYFCDKCGKRRHEFDERTYGMFDKPRSRHKLLHGRFTPHTSHWLAIGMEHISDWIETKNRQHIIIVKK